MSELKALSASEQLVSLLENEIFRGRWIGEMPGEEQLGIGHSTARAALRQLETTDSRNLLLAGGP